MGRFIALTLLSAVAVAVLLYGIVLNGFGLFSEPGERASVAPAETIATTTVETAASEPGSAGTTQTLADPAIAPETGTERTETTGKALPALQPVAPDTQGQQATGEQATTEREPGDPKPPQVATARVARDVTPPNVLSRPTSRYVDPATLEKQEAEEPEQPDVRRYHRIIVRDAGTLEAGDVTIRLAGVSPVAADKTCTDENGSEWPCGRAAAAALRMLIRHRAVDCAVERELPDGIVGTCSMGLQDINGWLVGQGWAEAEPDAGYGAEADAARAEKRGIYLAEWTPKGSGGTGSVPQAAFTAPAIPTDPFSSGAVPDVAAPNLATGSIEGAVQGPAN